MKALYMPEGKAQEYAFWGLNIYKSCSNDCSYCYLKKGVLATQMGGDKPMLKSCFKDEADALKMAQEELEDYRWSIRAQGGVLMSFSTDPCLDETIEMTLKIAFFAARKGVPILILTKMADWVFTRYGAIGDFFDRIKPYRKYVAFGFTLTGHDELEPNAAPNKDRIRAMRYLHDEGFLTFASIEPVIDFDSSMKMISQSLPYCDHYKIGLLSGKTNYDAGDVLQFARDLYSTFVGTKKTVYIKESLRALWGGKVPQLENFVGVGYDIFNLKG